jgi:hypothetical protein
MEVFNDKALKFPSKGNRKGILLLAFMSKLLQETVDVCDKAKFSLNEIEIFNPAKVDQSKVLVSLFKSFYSQDYQSCHKKKVPVTLGPYTKCLFELLQFLAARGNEELTEMLDQAQTEVKANF